MIFMLNVEPVVNNALKIAARELNVNTQQLVNLLLGRQLKALVTASSVSVAKIVDSLALTGDVIRMSMSEDEYETFCHSDVTLEELENRFSTNLLTVAEEGSMQGRALTAMLADLFLKENITPTLLVNNLIMDMQKEPQQGEQPNGEDLNAALREAFARLNTESTYEEAADPDLFPERTLEESAQEVVSVLESEPNEAFTLAQLVEYANITPPAQFALVFARAVRQGEVEGVSVMKNSEKKNVYTFTQGADAS